MAECYWTGIHSPAIHSLIQDENREKTFPVYIQVIEQTIININTRTMETNNKTKICTKCGKELPISDFYRNVKTKDGLHNYCKTCFNEYKRIHRMNSKQQKEIENKSLPKNFFSPATGGGQRQSPVIVYSEGTYGRTEKTRLQRKA